MLEKILRVLRKMLPGTEVNSVLRKEAATAIIAHELATNGVGYFVVTMPATHGMLVEYATDMAYSATIESYAAPAFSGGTPYPLRNRYLGAPGDEFFDVVKAPTVTDEGTLLTSVKYGAGKKAGAETGTSWFYIPAGLTILFKYISHAASNNIVTRVNAKLVSQNLID